MMRHTLVLSLALLLAACSDDSSSIDAAPGIDAAAVDGSAPTADAATPTADAAAPTADAAPGVQVGVSYGGSTTTVTLAALPATTYLGSPSVLLSDAITAAVPGHALSTLAADFVAYDGFTPGSKPNCTTLVPVVGDTLAQGYILLGTGDLEWDDSLGYPGCLNVGGLVTITVTDH